MSEKLLKEEDGTRWVKQIKLLDRDKLRNLSPKTLEIFEEISRRKTYPKEIAETMDLHEQKVYYHIRKLESLGLVEVWKKERKGGALCKYYRPVAEAFGFNLSGSWSKAGRQDIDLPEKLLSFFSEFIQDGTFQGSIVVGSPKEHGPFMTAARDGHYAVQLGVFLGGFCDLEERFIIKLDTEVKAEEALDRNLILVGGPITNTVSRDLNEKLDVRFDWEKTWKIVSEKTGNTYSDENLGLVAKIEDRGNARILLSGLDFKGTKSCVIAVTQHLEEVLGDYRQGEEFYRVIRGLDRDGDGKTDDIEIME
ncbi:MAG: S-layer protein [Candidatus Aenigmatarchaeota archaeon]